MAGSEKTAGLARTYAEALLRVAEERGVAEALLAELEQVVALSAEHPGFRRALLSLIASPAQRATFAERVFRGRLSDVLVDFYQVMNRKGRPELLPEVAVEYRKLFQAARGIVDVRVTSAVPLTAADRERLAAVVRSRTGLVARLLEQVDPAVLGGLVVRVRDGKFDTTLQSKLERLHGALLERASTEIIQSRSPAPEVKQ